MTGKDLKADLCTVEEERVAGVADNICLGPKTGGQAVHVTKVEFPVSRFLGKTFTIAELKFYVSFGETCGFNR